MDKFYGSPYPITKHPNGFFHTITGLDSIKADMLALLLTNPGERVMLPDYGTPLRQLIFEPNDPMIEDQAREMIAKSIEAWEPRVTIEQIHISSTVPEEALHPEDTKDEAEHILYIGIDFFDPDNIKEVQKLELQVPLSGG